MSSAARVAQVGQRLGRLAADEALELGPEPEDVADVGLLGGDEVLHGGEVRQLQRGEEVREGDLLHLELLLEHRPAAQPALDLLRAHVLAAAHVLGADPLPATDQREEDADEHERGAEDAGARAA